MNGTEVYIDANIHQLIDVVFARTYRRTDSSVKDIIRDGNIKLDVEQIDPKQYVPAFDCLYYPTVSESKCADEYDEEDSVKLDKELEKYVGHPIPTYQIYRVTRLNNELKYFLKLALHSKFNPQEGIGSIGYEFFIRLFWFIYSYFPDPKLQNQFRSLWCATLENLKTDSSAKRRLSFEGPELPLGLLAADQIEFLKRKIGCD